MTIEVTLPSGVLHEGVAAVRHCLAIAEANELSDPALSRMIGRALRRILPSITEEQEILVISTALRTLPDRPG
jgi:hypothetical protein